MVFYWTQYTGYASLFLLQVMHTMFIFELNIYLSNNDVVEQEKTYHITPPIGLVVCVYKGTMPYFILVQQVYDVLSLCLFYIIEIKFCSNRLTTEGNLAARIVYVTKWTNEQRQTEDGLNTKIQDQAKTM